MVVAAMRALWWDSAPADLLTRCEERRTDARGELKD
jgi:hypothetical protein